jgi:ribosomal protein S27AE
MHSNKKWNTNPKNKIKIRAHYMLNKAVNNGLLKRENCFLCGTDQQIVAHHDDYRKPLKVKWVCKKCHRIVHSKAYNNGAVAYNNAGISRGNA